MARLDSEDATKYRFAALGEDQSQPREAVFCGVRAV